MSYSLIELLRQSVARRPQAVALVHGGERIDYADLWRRVQGLAAFLRREGLAPGGRVALLMENSPDYVCAYYAVLVAGGVVVALSTQARHRDINHQIRHCGAGWLLTDGRHPELAGIDSSHLSVLRSDQARWAEALACAPGPLVQPTPVTPAAIIYTSGTTGQPKGVTLSHANLAHNVRAILAYLELGPQDVIVNVLPFHYSYGNSVLHTHLAAGACLVLDRSLVYPQGVLEAMVTERATGFSGVPASYAVLLSRSDLERWDLSALRYFTQAGGPMAPEQVERVRGAVPKARFFVMYGQTEATARLTWLPPERFEEKRGSVGIPIPGVEISLRDEQGRAVTPGQTGELWARGGNIMLGYWNDPEQTRRVIEDGWLKTGDLAHQDRDGYIFIDGRRSDMIKCGAHRISPAEIEEVLCGIPGVVEAAVTGIPDELLGQVVKAVVVRRADTEIGRMEVQRHCRRQLAGYKVPKVVEFAERLPRTASGKIQRFLLGAQTQGDRDVSTGSELR